MNRLTEHEVEVVAGVPGRLPDDEQVLWQGKPAFVPVSRRAFHVVGVGIYFVLLAIWQVLVSQADGAGLGATVAAATWSLALGVAGIALLFLLGWLVHRTTIYTFTNKRVIMKIGMALPMSLNIPFKAIEKADCAVRSDGSGDISLKISDEHRIAWAILWPHARPWHIRNPQPTLRSLPDARVVSGILQNALQASLDSTEPGDSVSDDTRMTRPTQSADRLAMSGK